MDTTTTIGNRVFLLQRMPAKRALVMKMRIVKLLAPFARDIEQFSGGMPSQDVVIGMLQEGVPGVDAELLVQLVVDLCETARVVGGPNGGDNVAFDVVFTSEDLLDAYMLAWKTLELNFSKYLKDFGLVSDPQKATPIEGQSNNSSVANTDANK